MDGCVPRVVGHLLAVGVPEVERTMTNRIEELRAQQKERGNKASHTDLFARGMWLPEAEAALTEALDIAVTRWRSFVEYQALVEADRVNREFVITEQERLLERAKWVIVELRQFPNDTEKSDRFLSDLNARSVTALGVNEGQTSAAPETTRTQGPTDDHEQGAEASAAMVPHSRCADGLFCRRP